MGNFLQTVAAMACLKSLLMIFNMAFWVRILISICFILLLFRHTFQSGHHINSWVVIRIMWKWLHDGIFVVPPSHSIQMFHTFPSFISSAITTNNNIERIIDFFVSDVVLSTLHILTLNRSRLFKLLNYKFCYNVHMELYSSFWAISCRSLMSFDVHRFFCMTWRKLRMMKQF